VTRAKGDRCSNLHDVSNPAGELPLSVTIWDDDQGCPLRGVYPVLYQTFLHLPLLKWQKQLASPQPHEFTAPSCCDCQGMETESEPSKAVWSHRSVTPWDNEFESQVPPCCSNSATPTTVLESCSPPESGVEAEPQPAYLNPWKTSSGLLAEMQAKALQRVRGTRSSPPNIPPSIS